MSEFIAVISKVLFYVSLIGMLLSVPLCSSAVRDFLVATWVRVRSQAEIHSPQLILQLTKHLVAVFYERAPGLVAKTKILIIAYVSALIWLGYFFVLLGRADPLGLRARFIVALLTSPGYFLYEFLLAFLIVNSFKNAEQRGLFGVFARACLSLAFCIAVSLGIAVVVVTLGITPKRIPQALVPVAGAMFGLVSPLVIPLLAGWSNYQMHFLDYPFVIPIALTYGGGVVLFLLAAVCIYSKPVLRCAAFLVENLSGTAYRRIFQGSLVLFSISTGLMQAFGIQIPR